MGSTFRGVHIEIALVQHDGGIGVFDADVTVGDVIDAAISDILSGPGLEAGSVLFWSVSSIRHIISREKSHLSIQQGHILDVRMLDIIQHTSILPDASHADAVGVVAPQILHEDVGSVGLGREAVVANINSCVCHAKAVHV